MVVVHAWEKMGKATGSKTTLYQFFLQDLLGCLVCIGVCGRQGEDPGKNRIRVSDQSKGLSTSGQQGCMGSYELYTEPLEPPTCHGFFLETPLSWVTFSCGSKG